MKMKYRTLLSTLTRSIFIVAHLESMGNCSFIDFKGEIEKDWRR